MHRLKQLTPYERRSEQMLPRPQFVRRLATHFLAASLLMAGSLGIGVAGYHTAEGLSWLDALLNASMILGGMGPVSELRTVAGKLFASFYSLFSGVVFLVTASILIAPVAHRLLHWLHLEALEE